LFVSDKVVLAIDVMGGDNGPGVILEGLSLALQRYPNTSFLLYGDEKLLKSELTKHDKLQNVSTIYHTDVVVRMDEKPSQALRHGRWKSSMWKALEAVKSGEASVCVSAGNTGALMAMAKFCLRTMADIERPAIAAIWPTSRSESIVLDVGATVGADSQQLIDFAILGGAMARALFNLKHPTIGLLNVGTEDVKGIEEVREAGRILRDADLPSIDYKGFVEGSDIGKGSVDVIVTEGFAGNIALKTAEGTARQIAGYLRAAMNRSLRSRLGYLLAKPAFEALRSKMDPSKVNGGVFLGLNGLVVKSHGGADSVGIASAVQLAHDMARNNLKQKIADDLTLYHREGFQTALKKEQSE
jgi:glycerol-3-phosphate acyltransferase PlsX